MYFDTKYPGCILGATTGYMEPKILDWNEISDKPIEVGHFLFDESKGSYEEFCKLYFTFHDPTTKNY